MTPIYLPVLFAQGSDRASKEIERFGGKYSHAATLLPNRQQVIDARSDVIQGIPAGVQTRPLAYLLTAEYTLDLYKIPCTAKQLGIVYDRLKSQLGKPYDKIAIVDFGTGMITGGYEDRDWRDKSGWFCDELCVWSWEEAGIVPMLQITPNRIPPGPAALIAQTAGAVVLGNWRPG